MQFIATDNFLQSLRSQVTLTSKTFKDISGSNQTLYYNSGFVWNLEPFYVYGSYWNTDYSSASTYGYYLYPVASGDDDYTSSSYSITNSIGTATIRYARDAKGWTATITITGTEVATIKSLVFTRYLTRASGGASNNAVIFILKLDNPVELNAENNYTVNFTFAIEF